ncbi:helix-turn-helix domain-containing protein [Modestobacter sp. Leaf380]|uniref:winged helix-turn-helix domain-containing protein n=1 Tax=Modestobacter sp. Leaf380 TaxID=1736356 RepID=UPI0006F4C84C|nr:helix-turn-helix domain-containing protein [Modestobacter sp. Leaf380]KQS66944.1 hypothetical protein ASG41_11235 [Modestobacter sp. Leaf380]
MTQEPGATRPVHDPRVLRGLAHPVRSRIVDEMYATGPVRAADVARELGIPANQASFHLRQLAKYGLVEEAEGEGRDRRDRVWRLVAEHGLSISLDELEAAPGGAAAVGVFRRQSTAWGHAVVDAAHARRTDDATTVSITNVTMRLTKAEAEELAREVDAVLARWSDRTRGADDGADRRTYLVAQYLQPYPDTLSRS